VDELKGVGDPTGSAHNFRARTEMPKPDGLRFILGSRSPRRLELLQQIVAAGDIEVLPPRSPDETDFDNLHDWPAIESRLVQIAQAKWDDVLDQLGADIGEPGRIVVAADTVVVVGEAPDSLRVLGQPPDDPNWPSVVRRWFLEDYAGKTHTVATALCVAPTGALGAPAPSPKGGDNVVCRTVTSTVTFHGDVDRWLDWYLATGEPRGKAGGYAVQGAGSIFVSRVEGSISNVIGLPLEALLEIIRDWHLI
jgi:septum formation protein